MTNSITTCSIPTQLPPDPEGMNDDRAAHADTALDAYMAETRADPHDALQDLLADLHHWADRNGFAFDACLKHARRLYADETAPDRKEPLV